MTEETRYIRAIYHLEKFPGIAIMTNEIKREDFTGFYPNLFPYDIIEKLTIETADYQKQKPNLLERFKSKLKKSQVRMELEERLRILVSEAVPPLKIK
ncbi:hypothetical protein J4225_03235 [Candidatus Pacearchaeota archaeon]|nr:hypothetical protein [Candidatus Pacearchaeota archaeon]